MNRTSCRCGLFWMLAGTGWADEKPTREFIKQHCADCHDADERKGDLDLTALKTDFTSADNFTRWVKVCDRIESGEMPPKNAARSEAAERAALLDSPGKELATTEARTLVAGGGRTTVRRMNRVEYEHALRDLLALPLLRVKELRTAHGMCLPLFEAPPRWNLSQATALEDAPCFRVGELVAVTLMPRPLMSSQFDQRLVVAGGDQCEADFIGAGDVRAGSDLNVRQITAEKDVGIHQQQVIRLPTQRRCGELHSFAGTAHPQRLKFVPIRDVVVDRDVG